MAEIHALWPEPPLLSPARDRLRHALAALDAAQRQSEDRTRPLQRLDQVSSEAAELERELPRLQCEDEALLGEWIAQGSIGPRPEPSAATVATKARLAELAPDLRGADAARPAARAMQQSGFALVAEAATERDLALSAVALEAAEPVAGELTTALNSALALEARLLSLRDELRAHPDNGNGASADAIDVLIRAAKAAAGVPRNSEAGRRLLDALARDPSAVL
jgi:hypothetical protein